MWLELWFSFKAFICSLHLVQFSAIVCLTCFLFMFRSRKQAIEIHRRPNDRLPRRASVRNTRGWFKSAATAWRQSVLPRLPHCLSSFGRGRTATVRVRAMAGKGPDARGLLQNRWLPSDTCRLQQRWRHHWIANKVLPGPTSATILDAGNPGVSPLLACSRCFWAMDRLKNIFRDFYLISCGQFFTSILMFYILQKCSASFILDISYCFTLMWTL